jgi:hypothetical protein
MIMTTTSPLLKRNNTTSGKTYLHPVFFVVIPLILNILDSTMRKNESNVNKTLALLHTTKGKDEPNIVLCGNRNGHHNTERDSNSQRDWRYALIA